MTNTIPNVPRELYTCIGKGGVYEHIGLSVGAGMARGEQRQVYRCTATGLIFHRECIDFKERMERLSAQSPAGVDGLNTDRNAAFKACPESGCDWGSFYLGWKARGEVEQAIIDGLRGEVADLRSMLATVSKAGLRVRTERDQHAKRIGELEAALEFACKSLAQVTSSDGSGHADIAVSVLRMAGTKDADALHVVDAYKAGAKWRIDAALSAGKEGE